MKKYYFFFLVFAVSLLQAQEAQPPYTVAKERLEGYQQRQQLMDNSLVNAVKFKSVGPTVMSGRVADIAVNEADPTVFYVGYASGGLWKTENNGTSFVPLFDDQAVMSIGDIAVDWKKNVIWVGTGENNSSRSSYSGVGMYRSSDGGKTWEHRGLEESHHIGRIILHPDNPDVLWVAVLGHLYSPNKERGVYKTTDGGKTWKQVLFVNENAGGIDLISDPKNPDELYAAMWDRQRRAWNFWEGGEGSGIYKSTDGGEKWEKITTKKSGFPVGEGVGRIGLDFYNDGETSAIFAVLDNQFRRASTSTNKTETGALTQETLKKMSKNTFLTLPPKKVKSYLRDNDFPKKYTARKVMSMVKEDKIEVRALAEYLENANSLLFNTPVKGAEVYRSDDGGKTWKKTHKDYVENTYYSYGYYFGQIRVAANDINRLYIMGVPILTSADGGKTWENINKANVHADHHALWVNPKKQGHLINGNDGGINISYDNGENWMKCNSIPLGQYYAIAVDMERPYNIYGGFQDNGVWYGSSNYRAGTGWHGSGEYGHKSILGGDGMQVAVDTRDNATVYTGFQFGNYFRINRKTGKRAYITPKHELGDRPYRWNWQTPIHLSIHNQDILYMGANKLLRSFDQGSNFTPISDDLTTGGKKGDVPYGTLTTIHESPLKFGLIYTGSDDGLIYRTDDGGNTWKKLSDGLPQDLWVSKVQASAHEEGTVYATLNGYRWDDFKAYCYKSTDYGKTWKAIGNALPAEPINVIKEDPKNADLLYVGTDHGLYVSLNGGATFMGMNNELPAVAVHDVLVHPRDNDLIVGTHGRSLYVANAEHLQQLTEEVLASSTKIFDLEKVNYSSRWGSKGRRGFYQPKVQIPIFSKNGGAAEVAVKMSDITVKSWKVTLSKGLNYLSYDLTIDQNLANYIAFLNKEKREEPIEIKEAEDGKQYLKAGKYEIQLKTNAGAEKTTLMIKKPKNRQAPLPKAED